MLNSLEIREAVHVTLLRRLLERVPEGLRLKGGVNLRLFYESLRYSEDMDLDADRRHRNKLLGVLEKIVGDPGYRRELDALGIDDIRPNDVQPGAGDAGLKFKLQAVAAGVPYHTKVEVSFRETSPADWAEADGVPSRIAERYGLPSFEVNRYGHAAAVVQKVNALATRGDVQARDIFDLDWLLDDARFPGFRAPAVARLRSWHRKATLQTASQRCLEIGDNQYRDQVESYLDAASQAQFSGHWDEMRLRVQQVIEVARTHPDSED